MADFGKINPEKAKAIINALKDGKINPQEMKKLGLTEQEAKALNEAFTNGSVEVGDLVLFNKGQITKDGKKMQITATGKRVKNNEQENDGFWAKAGKFLLSIQKYAIVPTPLIFASCAPGDDVTNYEINNNNNANIYTKVAAELANLTTLIYDVLQEIKKGNKSNEEIIKLLIQTMGKIDEGNETLKEIKELLIKNHKDDVDYQKRVLLLLSDIKALIIKFGNSGDRIGNAILGLLEKLGENVDVELDAIEELLKRIANNQDITNDKLNKLSKLFERCSIEMIKKLDIIIAMLNKNSPDYNDKLDMIIKLLETMDANADVRNQKVLDAIAKLGVDITGNLAAILEAIQKLPASEQKDYTEILNAILDKIKEGNAQNDANFKAVLEKIKDLGVSVAYGMNAILEAIQNQPDYTSRLDAIIAKLDALGAKAQEILEAIKDHDVKITVDVTGKVTCECNCNCGKPHEGIIGDLEDLLG